MPPHALRCAPCCALRCAPRRSAPRPSRSAAGPQRAPRGARMAPARAAITDVFALDFDGVVCDSVGESALSAWAASEQLWPDVFCAPGAAAQKARVLEEMRAVRPVIETGYENLVQTRLLLEARAGTRPEDMLRSWSTMLPENMARWALQRAPLVELFGSTRDAWMKADMPAWLAANRLYPGVAEPLRAAVADPASDVYIVTTKQARFTHALLRDLGGLDFPMERIYSQTASGRPKTEVLEKLGAGAPPGCRLTFVEDKLSTLEAVAKAPGFEAWRLYLVDWGYNTAQERERAAANPRITVIGVHDLPALLRVAR